MADRVGEQLGHYRLIRLLGTGGFAEVYLAEHFYLKTQAAIKVLHTQLTHDDQEHFLSEAQTIARLRHPHIVHTFDFGIESGMPYLAMDYAPGGTLRQRHPRGTKLSPAIILAYVQQIADALQYAHEQRLIHRDIKPENLLLGQHNEVLLSDFGIATVAQTTSDLKTQGFAGTATYAAPEQLRGKPVLASDQYALGVIVYEWLCGSPPFLGSPLEVVSQQVLAPPPPLRERLPEIAPAVEQVVMTALSKEPKERFGSVRAFARAIEQALQITPAALSTSAPPAVPASAGPAQPGEVPLSDAPTQQVSLPPAAPAGWANATPPFTPTLESTFTSPPPVSDTPDGPKAAPPDAVSKPPERDSAPKRQRRRSKGRVAVLVFLLVALLAGGGFLGYTYIVYQQGIAAAAATATAQEQGNAQAVATIKAVNATDTASAANVQATASAQARATAGVLQTATTGQPDYSDPLTQGNTTNQTWDNDGSSCFFASDGYHIYSKVSTQGGAGPVCRETGRSFQNATITIDMNLHGGYSGGLIFRWLENQAYFFEVGAGGNYHIGLVGVAVPLRDWTDSPAIHKGLHTTNTIQVIARGNVLMFYVNGMYLTTIEDSTVGAGVIGLFCETDNSGPGDAVFSNLKVYVTP